VLFEARDNCRRICEAHAPLRHELHEVVRRIACPEIPDIDPKLSIRIQQHRPGQYGECMRLICLGNNIVVALAAFRAATREFPGENWFLLRHGHQIIGRYNPEKGISD
jgi:hypothetical protein